jgi:hypothetical protein
MLSRYLYLAGAFPFLLLGVAHVLHTPTRPEQTKGPSPCFILAEALLLTAW